MNAELAALNAKLEALKAEVQGLKADIGKLQKQTAQLETVALGASHASLIKKVETVERRMETLLKSSRNG
jgi:prefoldin subunit 5